MCNDHSPNKQQLTTINKTIYQENFVTKQKNKQTSLKNILLMLKQIIDVFNIKKRLRGTIIETTYG